MSTSADLPGSAPVPASRHVRLTAAEVTVMVAIGAALGLLLGWGLPWLAGLVIGLEWFPAQDLFRLVDRLVDEHAATRWVLLLLLPFVGATAGYLVSTMAVTVRITDAEIELLGGKERRRRFARSQVARVVLDGRDLALRDDRDVDLISEKLDVSPDLVAVALRDHDWAVERH